MTYPSLGSTASPPQFPPPNVPGKTIVNSLLLYGRYGPPVIAPPPSDNNSLQNFSCSGVTVATSSGLNFTRDNGGALSGKGCVGHESSPGTSLFGTGRSSMP